MRDNRWCSLDDSLDHRLQLLQAFGLPGAMSRISQRSPVVGVRAAHKDVFGYRKCGWCRTRAGPARATAATLLSQRSTMFRISEMRLVPHPRWASAGYHCNFAFAEVQDVFGYRKCGWCRTRAGPARATTATLLSQRSPVVGATWRQVGETTTYCLRRKMKRRRARQRLAHRLQDVLRIVGLGEEGLWA